MNLRRVSEIYCIFTNIIINLLKDDIIIFLIKVSKITCNIIKDRYFKQSKTFLRKSMSAYFEILKISGIIPAPFSCALNEVLKMEESQVLKFFKALKNEKKPIRSHYFWPLIIKASQYGNDNILRILKEMQNLNVRCCTITCSKVIFPNYVFGKEYLLELGKI